MYSLAEGVRALIVHTGTMADCSNFAVRVQMTLRAQGELPHHHLSEHWGRQTEEGEPNSLYVVKFQLRPKPETRQVGAPRTPDS